MKNLQSEPAVPAGNRAAHIQARRGVAKHPILYWKSEEGQGDDAPSGEPLRVNEAGATWTTASVRKSNFKFQNLKFQIETAIQATDRREKSRWAEKICQKNAKLQTAFLYRLEIAHMYVTNSVARFFNRDLYRLEMRSFATFCEKFASEDRDA